MRIGFIGCGGAGGHRLQALKGKGFKTLEIQSSMEDVKNIYGNLLTVGAEYGGTDRNRDLGSKIIMENAEKILQTMQDTFLEEKLVVILSSSGGGFGSGSTIVLNEMLRDLGYYAISVMYTPEKFEGEAYWVNHFNSMLDFSESELLYSYVDSREDVADWFIDLQKERMVASLDGASYGYDKPELHSIYSSAGLFSITKDGETPFLTDDEGHMLRAYVGIGSEKEEMLRAFEGHNRNLYPAIYEKLPWEEKKEYIIQGQGGFSGRTFEAVKTIIETKREAYRNQQKSNEAKLTSGTTFAKEETLYKGTEEVTKEVKASAEDLSKKYTLKLKSNLKEPKGEVKPAKLKLKSS